MQKVEKYAYRSKKNEHYNQGKFNMATLSGSWAFCETEEQANKYISTSLYSVRLLFLSEEANGNPFHCLEA